jgi:L-cysteine:1D-myo-inositol 2-amino-2-deoxy-alpha-D-glucopyranoside ligase
LHDYPPAAIRMLCLNRPWAQSWDYTRDALDDSAAVLDQLYAAAARPGSGTAGQAAVPAALLRDLNVPSALAIALEDGGQSARTLVELLALS